MPDWSRIHNKTGFSSLSPFLATLSCTYRLAISGRLAVYKYWRSKINTLPGFVVSIGNITVGGTGKTPAAHMVAEWAVGEGRSTAIISRGYRGKKKTKILEVSDGDDIYVGPSEAGDEAYLLAKKLKNVPVIVSKDRYKAGLFAHNKFKTDFFILDDGFQHLALKRDVNILLIDGSNPFGNGHLLPWGPLREPLGQAARADIAIITRCRDFHFPVNGKSFLNDMPKYLPVFRAEHTPGNIVFPKEKKLHSPDFLNGKRIIAFAGIARPEVFKKTLEDLGAEVVAFKGLADHHFYKTGELQSLNAMKEELSADCVLTTEKDWVKIESISSEFRELGYLTIEFTFSSRQDEFFNLLRDNMNGINR